MKKIHTILFAFLWVTSVPSMAETRPHQSLSTSYPMSYGQWQEALLAGNGKTGIMVFGDPLHETLIFNDRRFNFPAQHPRSFNTVPQDTLARIKALCAEERFKEANDLAVRTAGWKDGGEGGRHPGYKLNFDLEEDGTVEQYLRSCDFATGVIRVQWKDNRGMWQRESFVSRPDNVAVTHLKAPTNGKLDCALSLSLDKDMGFPEGTKAQLRHEDGFIGIEVTYAGQPLTYGGMVRVQLQGGRQFLRHDTLFIENANEVVLTGSNYHYKYGLRTRTECRKALEKLPRKFATLLKRHTRVHSAIYNRVNLDFNAKAEERTLSNEELLQRQKDLGQPLAALWERIFDAGRYHFLSSSSEETPPDLLGIWTGDCNAGWGGFYHLDSNLNLQVTSGNVGAMPEAMEGYFHLIETWRKDFERNAHDLLGCRGMLAGGNSPGLSSGLISSINTDYPYQYATGEMGWLIYPFWEYYLVTRNEDFLRQRLFPLLCAMGSFYEDFLQLKDSNGHYILAGSVSPENQPSNLRVSLLNNSTFDIAGARFLLSTLVKVCDMLNEEQGPNGRRTRWNALLGQLPPYLINEEGALKEWSWPGLGEEYGHRHSSHLLAVSPYREIAPHGDPVLYKAACKALELKDQFNYGGAGHGFLQGAFIAAGLHKSQSLERKVLHLLQQDFYYSSLCTAHFGNRQVFCTDVAHAIPGIFYEMLIGSDETGIDLLPALPDSMTQGSISGIETRCGVHIDNLTWDMEKEEATVTLTSRADCKLQLRTAAEERDLTLKAGKTKEMKVRI